MGATQTQNPSKRRPGRPRSHREPRRDAHIWLPEPMIDALAAVAPGQRSSYVQAMLMGDWRIVQYLKQHEKASEVH